MPEEIHLDKLLALLDKGNSFVLGSKAVQYICNDPLGENIIIQKDEKANLAHYSRNLDGTLCFQVVFNKTWAFYYPKSMNTYEYPRPTGEEKEFKDLFYIVEHKPSRS